MLMRRCLIGGKRERIKWEEESLIVGCNFDLVSLARTLSAKKII
jgi:hypothetical protein